MRHLDNEEEFFKTYCQYCQRLDLMDMLNDAVVITAASNGMIVFMNKKACHMYGYSAQEYEQMPFAGLVEDVTPTVENRFEQVAASGDAGLTYIAHHLRKSGEIFTVEVSTRFLKLHGTPIFAALIRDITVNMQVQNEVQLASMIQKGFLPADLENELFSLKTIYYPQNYVSGDLYDYKWQKNTNQIYGYVIDIMGHGVATALQASALRVLFGQAVETESSLTEKLSWVNRQAMSYFAEGSFAAALLFVIDTEKKELSYASAGIHHFLSSDGEDVQVVTTPGLFLGIYSDALYTEHTMYFDGEHSFCFLTDGLMELLPQTPAEMPSEFEQLVSYLEAKTHDSRRHDDASALCMYIK